MRSLVAKEECKDGKGLCGYVFNLCDSVFTYVFTIVSHDEL